MNQIPSRRRAINFQRSQAKPIETIAPKITVDETKCQKCGRPFARGLTMHMRFCKG